METKSTKVQEVRETAAMLLVGLVVCAVMKASPDLYWAYVGGLCGKTVAFMWGKGKQYDRDVAMAAAPKDGGDRGDKA